MRVASLMSRGFVKANAAETSSHEMPAAAAGFEERGTGMRIVLSSHEVWLAVVALRFGKVVRRHCLSQSLVPRGSTHDKLQLQYKWLIVTQLATPLFISSTFTQNHRSISSFLGTVLKLTSPHFFPLYLL